MLTCIVAVVLLAGCTTGSSKKTVQMKNETTNFPLGTYGYDAGFLSENEIETIELKDEESGSCVLLAPGLQGRVMTCSAGGNKGKSFGWINYPLISKGEVSPQFNPVGGEERFWLGPEGGPWSIYFKPGTEQVFANWVVPKEIDTEPFDLIENTGTKAVFKKSFDLINYSGTNIKPGIVRTVNILSKAEIEEALGLQLGNSLKTVAFKTENILTNEGDTEWNETNGELSIWLLCMFNPSEEGIVFIPYKKGSESELGKIVTDDYFGKVPAGRLIDKDGILFFKVDGKHRSKIGIPPKRSLPYCGSYDPASNVLTILWYSQPETDSKYVNSLWGGQDDPLSGDVVNSYNDGPADDGTVMGPFYEIESSSPAAALKAGESITHIQQIFHISGNENELTQITEKIFSLSISEIKDIF